MSGPRKLAALGCRSLGITNRAAKGRSAVWTEGEVVRLFKRSWREGYHGLGAVIAPNVGRADIRPHAPDRFHDNWQSEFLGFAYAAIGAPVAANASVCRFARSAGPVFCSTKIQDNRGAAVCSPPPDTSPPPSGLPRANLSLAVEAVVSGIYSGLGATRRCVQRVMAAGASEDEVKA